MASLDVCGQLNKNKMEDYKIWMKKKKGEPKQPDKNKK